MKDKIQEIQYLRQMLTATRKKDIKRIIAIRDRLTKIIKEIK